MKTLHTFLLALAFAFFSTSVGLAQEGPSITTTSLPNGTVNQSYSGTLTCTNCKGYSFALVNGNNLPPGLSISSTVSSAASITGTPTSSGTYTFAIGLYFPTGGAPQAQVTLSITINAATAPPSITTTSLPNGVVNQGYSAQLTCSSCTNYSWSVTGGNLPTGISLSSAGAFSGIPTAGGTYSFQVTLAPPSDFNTIEGVRPTSISASFSITISANALTITTVNIPPGFQGTPYSSTLAVIGGSSPYTWSLSSTGSDGLTIGTNTGTLGGTPIATGQFTLVVTVNDSSGSTATKNFILTVAAGLSILNTSFPNGIAGTVYPTQTLSTGGGQPPYRWTVSAGALPPGLTLDGVFGRISGTPTANGAYPFTLTVTDNTGTTATAMLSITIGPTLPGLMVTPTQLNFTAISGGSAPAFQLVSILPPGSTPKTFTITVLGSPTWLTVSPLAGIAPSAVTVSVNQAGLSVSTTPYSATFLVTPGGAGQTPITVTVMLTVTTAPPMLTASPTALKFAAKISSPGIQEQAVLLENSGGGGALALSAAVVSNSPWIASAALSASQTGPNAPVLLRVTINSQGLTVGSHHDIVRITYPGGTLDIAVSLFVANSGAILGVSVTGVRFPAIQGAGSSEVQTINVLDLGGQGTSLTWTATVQTGATWLNATPATGAASPGSPGKLFLSPGSGAAALPVGGAYGLIQVAAPGALNSPQFITAVFDVSPSTVSATPELQPTGLFFTATAGGATSATQTVAVYASSTTAVPFGFNATTTDGASWLIATTTTASASTPAPGQVLVSVNPASLAAGVYTGTLNIAMNGALRGVSVTVVVTGTATAKAQIEPATTAGCTPSTIAITPVGLVNYFSISAGWPAELIAQLNDNCGNALSTGAVSASFSNGDPPLSLVGDGVSNTYAASWQPGSVNPQMTVTVQALADPLSPATSVFLGGVNPNASQPPVVSPSAIYNIFFTPTLANSLGAGLPPGTVAQIYGTGLASQAAAPQNVPLPNQFDGTFVAIGGYFAPIFYVSGTQLNVEIPNELTANAQYPVYVSINGALTLPQTIDVPVLQPGMVTYPDGTAIAQHSGAVLVSASNPAIPGETLTIYLAGMGPTNVPVPSGQPTPTSQLDLVSTQPTVTVGSQNAAVAFAGLVPGGVGLYQINFVVPPGSPAGTLPLTVTQNSVASNTAQLIVGTPQ